MVASMERAAGEARRETAPKRKQIRPELMTVEEAAEWKAREAAEVKKEQKEAFSRRHSMKQGSKPPAISGSTFIVSSGEDVAKKTGEETQGNRERETMSTQTETSASSSDEQVDGRGFGDDYAWRSFESGLKEAEATGKPVTSVQVWCDHVANAD